MLRMALSFFIVALIAGLFGFGLIADLSFNVAKIGFFVFLALAIAAFVADAFQERTVSPV